MIGETVTCENVGCDIVFIKRTHNQCYHDDECCRLQTNRKIMEKYYEKRAQKMGVARQCRECSKPLSRYNSDSVCNSCFMNKEAERNQSVLSMLTNVAWQS